MMRTGEAVSNRDLVGMHHGMVGVRCWLQDFYPVKDKDGRLIGIGTILRDNTERARDIAALKRTQARNEMLVREVHHRIKNNLQIIVSMVQAHMREQPGENSAMEDLLTRVRATARLSGYLHLSSDLERVKICGLIRQICGDIEKSIGLGAPIHFMSVGEVAVVSDKALSIALTVNELVTNAMKHARCKHAAVEVTCTAMADGLSIRIRDEGGGLPAGFQLQGSHKFGMHMVKGMVSQLGGTLTAASDTGGAVFVLTIPLNTHTTTSAAGQQELVEGAAS
jgi:two-component sensor histidine kinase